MSAEDGVYKVGFIALNTSPFFVGSSINMSSVKIPSALGRVLVRLGGPALTGFDPIGNVGIPAPDPESPFAFSLIQIEVNITILPNGPIVNPMVYTMTPIPLGFATFNGTPVPFQTDYIVGLFSLGGDPIDGALTFSIDVVPAQRNP